MTKEVNHDMPLIGSLHNCEAARDKESSESAITNGLESAKHIPVLPDGENKLVKDYHEDQKSGEEGERPMGEEVKVEMEIEGGAKAPDGGWGWFVVLGAFLVHVIMGGFERSSGVIYLELLEKFDMSATETSWVLALFSTLRVGMGPVASMLCNKFSVRFVVCLGTVLSTAGVFISAYTPNLQLLYFSYGILAGIRRALIYCPCLIIVGYYFNKRRGVAVGLATSGGGVGSFLFPPMVESMLDYYDYQGTFLVLTGVISNFMVCGVLFRPLELHRKIMEYDRKMALKKKATESIDGQKKLLGDMAYVTMETKDRTFLRDQNAVKKSSSICITTNSKMMACKPSLFKRKLSQVKFAFKGTPSEKKQKRPLLELSLLRNYAFLVLCIQLFFYIIALNATYVFLPAIAQDRGLSKLDGAMLISVHGVGDALARIVMSIVLDFKRVKKYRLIIYNILMVWTGGVCVVIPMMRTFWQFSIVSALFGLLSGTYISQKSVVVVDILGVEKLSSSFGLLLLFQGLGSLIGPIVGAMFKDLMGTYDMAFYVGSSGIFLGGLVLATGNVWLHRQKKKMAETDTEDT